MNALQSIERDGGILDAAKKLSEDLESLHIFILADHNALMKAKADAHLWKQCADNLARHIQGVSDEDCKALENYERLKATT
jgi:hypothetical protein